LRFGTSYVTNDTPGCHDNWRLTFSFRSP